jgi:hypothetical protein
MIMAVELRKILDEIIEGYGDVAITIPFEDDHVALFGVELDEWLDKDGDLVMHVVKLNTKVRSDES